MAKKFLGLSMFLWVLILLVVLFFVYGGKKVSEGFTICKTENKTVSNNMTLKQCLQNTNKCKWMSGECKCCPSF